MVMLYAEGRINLMQHDNNCIQIKSCDDALLHYVPKKLDIFCLLLDQNLTWKVHLGYMQTVQRKINHVLHYLRLF